jgi:hypothetical protein
MVYIKKNLSKIRYVCPYCSKDFNNRKSDYNRHINKKKACEKENINMKKENINMEKENINMEKENINIENNNSTIIELLKKIINQNEKMNNIINQNKKMNNDILDLKNKISILKEDNKNLKNIVNYNTTNNNSNNNCIAINNFNNVNYLDKNFLYEKNTEINNETIAEINNEIIKRKKYKCIFKDCYKRPNFNLPEQKKPLYCLEHKKENMIDITSKRCIHNDCMKRPTFNSPDQIIPLYCFKHKKENMINVINKRCIHDGCIKIPNFNLPNETKALYCYEHKMKNMINIISKKCIHTNCIKQAYYNLQNETRALYCSAHKKENMILIRKKKCIYKGCLKIPIFNLPNETEGLYCSKHKNDNMINIKNKRLCKYCDIKEESNFICKECQKIKNKKEWSIVRYLRKVIDTNFEYNSSKMLQGCSKKRPDIYFELDKHCLIVEIDENQHNTYEDSCECSRINEIVNGIGGKSIIIIRYNPDTTKNKGKIIEINQEKRINLLVKSIKEELVKDYDKFIVKIIQLYYDDNYEEYNEIKEEEITKLVCI